MMKQTGETEMSSKILKLMATTASSMAASFSESMHAARFPSVGTVRYGNLALGDTEHFKDRNGNVIRLIRGQAGNKLIKKAAKGRIGLTHPTRGTMSTPTGRHPFSTNGY